jgi:phosphoribosylanthranilate isomerase
MMIKVCGITRREDAMAAADAEASALGFIFYRESPRYVTPERAAELGAALPMWKVGVFVDETAASIKAVMRAANLDVAQIYGGQAPSDARVWRAFRMTSELGTPSPEGAEAILLDGPTSGASFDWKLARTAVDRIIVAGGLDASNVAEAIRIARPWGVDASSRLETAPGVKDHEKIRAFVKAARETSA